MQYTIIDITDDDYGCEERPDDAETMCMVLVRDAQNNEKWVRIADAYLRENNLDIGSEILI